MVTTACERNCFYCPFRAGRGKTHRISIKPDDIASEFDKLQRARRVEGLFLSSGIIKGGVNAQDKILDTIEIVRRKYAYRGYVHMKLMPGAEKDQIKRAVELKLGVAMLPRRCAITEIASGRLVAVPVAGLSRKRQVVGLFKLGLYEFDSTYAFVSLQDALRIFDKTQGIVQGRNVANYVFSHVFQPLN